MEGHDSGDLARDLMEVILDKKGYDIVLLDLRPIVADYFLIASGDNPRQMQAIRESLLERGAELEQEPLHVEGAPESGWVLLDFGGVIVHLFTPPVREYYQLETLWSDAPLVVRMQ
ncbi:MAG: ribosome silencing factor [Chloroflexi bacterium]|nr:ribosome silencing factor [Chloroflexota bacterium]